MPAGGKPSADRHPGGPVIQTARVRAAVAFTLVEIMIVVVIIGLLSAIALPAFQRMRNRSLASRYANDFQKFAEAFQRYSLENGAWPPAVASPGLIPTGMQGYLPDSFTKPSPMGGGYTWSGASGRIRLINTNATDAVMQLVDAMVDDGNLSTGDFSSMTSGGYHYQLH
jgi:prepilin-type N-terminal cleavage/methylation domain-containing protein